MKIDEVMREVLLKTDTAAKGKATILSAGRSESSALQTEQALNAETGFPDLLQAFTRVVAMRQQLADQLPEEVKKYLASALGREQEVDPSLISRQSDGQPDKNSLSSQITRQPDIQLGASAVLRDGRAVMNTMRQIADDMDFVNRIPGFDDSFSSFFDQDAKQATLSKGIQLGQQYGSVGAEQSQAPLQVPSTSGTAISEQFSGIKLQQAVDNFFSSLANLSTNAARTTTSPAEVLATLVNKAVASGTIGNELNRWITVTDVVIGDSADLQNYMNELIRQMDPDLVHLAESTGRPELLKVWTVVQELTAQADGKSSTASISFLQSMPQGVRDALANLLQNLTAGAGGDAINRSFATSQAAMASRVSQFEMLVSSLTRLGGDMAKFLTELPAVIASLEKLMPARESNKAIAAIYDTLARSAPKWLRNLAQQSDSPDLLSFWVAAKVADLEPWIHLTTEERQQAADLLKSLATTYDQPEIFRSATDDGSAKGLTFQMALYAPGQEKPYPALIQIFEEKRDRGPGQPPEQEVWVRVSVETDYIGPVDLSFRLQDQTYLSIFTRFSNPEIATEFKECLPEIRAEFNDNHLRLKKIAVTERIAFKGA